VAASAVLEKFANRVLTRNFDQIAFAKRHCWHRFNWFEHKSGSCGRDAIGTNRTCRGGLTMSVYQGQTGSGRPTVRMTRLTPTGL